MIPEIAKRGILVNLVKIRKHGPYLETIPDGVEIIELGSDSTYGSLFQLARYLKQARPDVLFSDKDKVIRVAVLARKISRAPTRLVIRTGTTVSVDVKQRGLLYKIGQKLSTRFLYPIADSIITPSMGAAKDLSMFSGISLNRITAVPSPVITENLIIKSRKSPDHPWYQKKKSPIIVTVGELSSRKNHTMLLKAFSSVKKVRPCKLIIIGEGRERENLKALSSELGLTEDIAFLGFQENPYPFIKNADVFVLSSRLEGSPVVLMEALGLGVPMVSTDCPSGPREVLENGKYGKLVAIDDFKGMSEAILQTLESPINSEDLIEASSPYQVTNSVTAYLNAMGLN